jgi:hypothetical protein
MLIFAQHFVNSNFDCNVERSSDANVMDGDNTQNARAP